LDFLPPRVSIIEVLFCFLEGEAPFEGALEAGRGEASGVSLGKEGGSRRGEASGD
jgi:hypothetical protein